MKKKLIYACILLIIEFLSALFSIKFFVGSKSGLIISLVCGLLIFILLVYLMERNNLIIKSTKKAQAMFNYFDVEAVKDLLNSKKTKGDRFEMFSSKDTNQKITVLSIKILNNDAISTLEDDKRIKTLGKILELVEENVEKRYGLIYNFKDDIITVLFNTVYLIDDPEMEAIKAALNININLMKEREDNTLLAQTRLDYSIVNESMDFFIRDKRVIVNGNFELSNELLNISGEDAIYIPENIFKKYMNELDYDYLGKFYFSFGDVKVYKIIKVINEKEEYINTYKTSKIKLKKGSENKLRKFSSEMDKKKMQKHDEELKSKK